MPEPTAGSGTLAFIGLGNMGTPMARCLIDGGRDVVGFDLPETARRELAEAGGTPATSAAEAATGAGTVILMLPNSRIVEALVEEIADSLAPGTTVIDMSSSEPTSTRRLAEALATRDVTLVDAPV